MLAERFEARRWWWSMTIEVVFNALMEQEIDHGIATGWLGASVR